MEVHKFTGKNYDEVLRDALNELNLTEDEVIIHSEEKKMGLFKGNGVEMTVTPITEVLEYAKNYLEVILTAMGLEVNFETKIREKQIEIRIYSNDNPIIIGKEGRSLAALQTVVRLASRNKFGTTPYISLDVENYKDRQIMYLEKTARRIAKEVSRTKIPVELDNMNSYERLIVHQAISGFTDIVTESVGVDPNRHVVIKPKE